MSMLVEPGTQLAGRYRLQERVSELTESTLWRAVDEPLARTVAVRTFTGHSPHAGRVIAAARAASRVADSRLAQVFDADDSAPQPYLVCEWIDGYRLVDLLAEGPLSAQHAVGFIAEATDALAAAHATGLAHQRLGPSSLVWAKGGTVKITGLAIDAALQELTPGAEAPVADARALGALCYAALTAYWPGEADVGLPPAPRADDGSPVAVRTVRPDVPATVESVTARALGLHYDDTPSLDSPAEIREALSRLPRIAPLPPHPSRPQRGAARTGEWEGSTAAPAASSPAPAEAASAEGFAAGEFSRERHRRRPARVVLLSAVGVLVLAATALGAWEIGRAIDPSGGGNPAASAPPTSGGDRNAPQVVSVDGIKDYDPPATGGDGKAHPNEAPNAIDGNVQTLWTTQTYTGANLGQLKPGVGLMLDIGKPAPVGSVHVEVAGQGTTLELYAGNRPEINQMRRVASVSNASGEAVLKPQQPVKARHLLVWITKLPPVSDGYQAGVAEIVVRGAA